MGDLETRRGLRLPLRRRSISVFIIVLLVAAAVPAIATVYDFGYSSMTGTLRNPSVTLGAGTAGSSTISSVAADAATATATAGLTFYESANAQTSTPLLDGSASQGFTPGSVQRTSNPCAAGLTCSVAFTSNIVAGDILVVSIEWNAQVTAPTISDGQSGARCSSWTAATGSPVQNTGEAGLWYCKASTSGAATPTVTWTTTSTKAKIDIYEIMGYTTSPSCATGTGTGTALTTSSTIAISGTPFLVAGYGLSGAQVSAAGGGFTLADTAANNDGGSGEFSVGGAGVTSPTNFPATRSGGASVPWAGIGCIFPKATAASTTVTLTTTGTSDVILVGIEILNSGSQTVSTVTDSSSLAYASRAAVSFSTNVRVETWYATTTSAQPSDVITVTLSGMTDFVIVAFAVSGTDASSPFDPGVSSPPTATGTSTTPATTITTTYPDDFILGFVAAQSNPTVTQGAGFTLIASKSPTSNTLTGGSEYKPVTADQSSSSVGFTLGSSQNWAMIADAVVADKSSVSVDTSVATPGSSGSFAIPAGSSAFLWSPAYTVGGTLYAGNWVIDLWASKATSSGTLTVTILTVTSTNSISAEVLSSGTTGTITTSTTEVKTTMAGVGASIPSNGEILVVLTNPIGATTVTVSWGGAQLTNFQSPSTYNYLISLSNSASVAWNVNLATLTAQTSNLGRLTATLSFVSPASNQIIISSGTISQFSGSQVSLSASGTLQIQLVATANAVPTGSNVPSTITFSIKIVSSTSTAFAQYTVTLTIN